MTILADVPLMPAQQPPGRKPLLSVKIDPEVYRLAKTAAAWLGEDIAEYLSRVVRPIAQKDVDRICREAKACKPDPS